MEQPTHPTIIGSKENGWVSWHTTNGATSRGRGLPAVLYTTGNKDYFYEGIFTGQFRV